MTNNLWQRLLNALRRLRGKIIGAPGTCRICGEAGSLDDPEHEECLWFWAIR